MSSGGLQVEQRMKPHSFLRICTWPRPVPRVCQFLLLLLPPLPLLPLLDAFPGGFCGECLAGGLLAMR